MTLPQDKLVRVVVASPGCDEVQPVLGWGEDGQNIAGVMASLAMVTSTPQTLSVLTSETSPILNF